MPIVIVIVIDRVGLLYNPHRVIIMESKPLINSVNDDRLLLEDGGRGGGARMVLGSVQNGIAQTAVLIIANLAGAGILSLPKAIQGAGITAGAVMVVCSALLSGYTADVLSRCYTITLRQSSVVEHKEKNAGGSGGGDEEEDRESDSFMTRSPYAAIGQHAVGKVGAVAVTVCQFATQFSVMVVFFLIAGINLNKLVPKHSPLFYSLVCTGSLTPLMLLRPGHVWGTAVMAILATVILVGVIIGLCASDAPHDPHTPLPKVTFPSLGTAFGVILFGFGGHAILPALQATMKDPTPARFRQALFWSFSICTAMYLSTSIASVSKLGGTVSGDVLTNFESGVTNSFGLVSVTLHLLFAAVTVHIPVGQMIDHYCNASDFSLKQICIRTITMALVGLVIWVAGDHFFCVIGLVGGTCSNAMIFIFPPWFYLKLLEKGGKQQKAASVLMKLKMGVIMFIGTAGMVSTLIGAVGSCKDQPPPANHSNHSNHSNHPNATNIYYSDGGGGDGDWTFGGALFDFGPLY